MAAHDKLLELIDSQTDETARKQITDLLSIEGKAKLLDTCLAQRDDGTKAPPDASQQQPPASGGVAGPVTPGSSSSGVTPQSGNAPKTPF